MLNDEQRQLVDMIYFTDTDNTATGNTTGTATSCVIMMEVRPLK
ncbi:MAG: hypothetical protein ABFC94_08725 [Syntrophomonas sp.]